MAAPFSGPVATQEAAPPPAAMGAKVEPAEGASAVAAQVRDEDAHPPEKDEDDDGGAWETASLYEEILDEVEAFEYSANGESGVICAPQHSN